MLTIKIIKKWNLHLYAHNHFFFYVFSGFSSKNKILFFIFQFFGRESEKKIIQNFYSSSYYYEHINSIYNVLCFRIFAIKIIHLYKIMDNMKLPKKLLKQKNQDHLRQSYFMAYNEISNFFILSKFFVFHFSFFCGESENEISK